MSLMKEVLAHIVLAKKPEYLKGDFNINNNKISEGNDFIYTGIGIYKPKLFLSDRIILKDLANVLEFFLKSITQSKILPLITLTYFAC